jgi:hypothetical protein
MATSGLSGVLPAGSAPFVDGNGILTAYGRNLLNALIQRTGGATGADVTVIAAEAAAAQVTATSALTEANDSLKKAADLSDVANLPTTLANLQLVKQTGWAAPTGGAGSRAAVNTAYSQAPGVAYSQTVAQAMEAQIEVLSQVLGQLIIDLEAFKAIGP